MLTMRFLPMLFFVAGCDEARTAAAPRPDPPRPGVHEPPPLAIPVNDPLWANLRGLQTTARAYGEANWDDVRMRVVGHLAVLGRDRARAAALADDWAGCAARYEESAASLLAVKVSGPTGPRIRAALAAAATRDAALCRSLSDRTPPPPATGTLAPLRSRWVALVVRAEGGENVRAEAAALAATARAVVPPPDLSLDGFASFEERHALRVRLVEAWADAVSPFSPTEPFDYWTAAEVPRQAAGIAAAAEKVAAGAPALPRAPDQLPPPPHVPYTATELGALVTGDSLVDTLGFAGPRAIGTLSRLGTDDPEHLPWLTEVAAALEAEPPGGVPALVALRAAELDRFNGGIRYYAIKQLRNTAMRHLARDGRHEEALAILAANRPLHNQDWACPDREAILTAIEARLRLLAGDSSAAATAERGVAEVAAFLAHVAMQERNPTPKR